MVSTNSPNHTKPARATHLHPSVATQLVTTIHTRLDPLNSETATHEINATMILARCKNVRLPAMGNKDRDFTFKTNLQSSVRHTIRKLNTKSALDMMTVLDMIMLRTPSLAEAISRAS